MSTSCFSCGRIISGDPEPLMVVLPFEQAVAAGHVCDRCMRSVGQEIRLLPISVETHVRGYAFAGPG